MENSHIPLQPRYISSKEKEQLVDKLLACSTMRDKSLRNIVVEELSFANSILRDSKATNKEDLMTIVNRCLDFSDGLQQLVERIKYHEDDSVPIQLLNKFLEILLLSPKPILINVDLLINLYKITNNLQVEKDMLHHLYRQSVVDHRLPSKYQTLDENKMLHLMIQDLAQAILQSIPSRRSLTHPLLAFVKLLSQQVSNSTGKLLLSWLEEIATRENIKIAEEYSPSSDFEYATENSYYLLVKFKPRDGKKEEFDIRSWFIHEQDGKTIAIDGFLTEETKLEEIPLLLDQLISKCEEYSNSFTVELFLPFTLLHSKKADVHTWKLDFGFDNTVALSHKQPLVLRSYDRVYGINKINSGLRRRLRQAWESNWATYNKDSQVELQWTLKEEDSCKENLIAWLQQIACLAIAFVPPEFNEAQPHIFKKMVSAGTSVALWPRLYPEHMDEEAIDRAYRNLLEGCHCSRLPILIWDRRKVASIDETLLANHLTLFWDDPYRLPSDAPDASALDKYPLAFARERV